MKESENIKNPHVGLGVPMIHVTPELIREDLEAKENHPILFVGAGGVGAGKTAMFIAEETMRIAKESGKNIVVVSGGTEDFDLSKLDLSEMAKPYLDTLRNLPLNEIQHLIKESIPNKLQLLKDLNLSPQQKDYFLNAPPQRLDGEKFEDYKIRRMLNKLLIKYRGKY